MDWAIITIDGGVYGRYESFEAAEQVAKQQQRNFRRNQGGSLTKAYLPMSICHVACGAPSRDGQHSTSWSVGCEHEAEAREAARDRAMSDRPA